MKTITYNPDTHRLVPVEPNNTALDWVDPGFGTRKEAWERILASFPQPGPVELRETQLVEVEPALYAEFSEDGGWLGEASEYQDHLEEPIALYTAPPDYEEIKRQRDTLLAALEMLVKESREVADDHHRPRYARLDGAILSDTTALEAMIQKAVKESNDRLYEERELWDRMFGDGAKKLERLELELDDCLYVLEALWDKKQDKSVTQKWADILIRNKRATGASSAEDTCHPTTE